MMRSRHFYLAAILVGGCVAGWRFEPVRLSEAVAQEKRPVDRSAAASAEIDRSVLPVKEPTVIPITEMDARNAKAPPRFELKAPPGAPNVVIVLIDDMGFGQCSAFGGPLHMPTADRLAARGLKYNRFHTTALCSPTRAGLLTGRNHHSNNMGGITEIATAFPGNTGQRPQNIAPLAEMLRLNGFNTSAFGKSHETAAWEVSVSGPFDRWPTMSGFEKFYGFIGGETNQWNPLIYEGTTKIEPPADGDYHFMTDMTNQAIRWMQAQQSLTPDKPFFMYFAPGATHAPHHAPKEWAARYAGKFDHGWDKQRELTLAKQIELGVVPKGTMLAPKPPGIKDWDTLTETEKKVFCRQMEVFAGYGEYCDHEIGRLVSTLEEMGELDTTLFVYIVGDNGASAEGGLTGLFNELTFFNGVNESIETVEKRLDELGGPTTFNHYAAGWAVAGDTPFTWTKQMAADFGGTRNGLIVHWPKGIKARGELRSQFHHVIDIAPTVLEACRLPEPKEVNGITQRPIEGVSMAYSFDDPTTKDRRKTQYFEIAGNRAIYHEGWVAMTVHRIPWEFKPLTTLESDKWKLFHVEEDFSEAVDLAEKHPEKVRELQEVFLKEAVKYHVLPIDDRSVERFNAELAGRPELIGDRKSLTLHAGAPGMMENAFINTKNRSHSITATVEIPKDGANGVILCQGGRFAGWSLYVKDGKPCYAYNWFGLETYKVAAEQPLPPGTATIRYVFTFDGGMPGSGGVGAIFVNDAKVAEGKIQKTVANTISLDETADIGEDTATTVTDDYKERYNKFTGKIGKVTIELR